MIESYNEFISELNEITEEIIYLPDVRSFWVVVDAPKINTSPLEDTTVTQPMRRKIYLPTGKVLKRVWTWAPGLETEEIRYEYKLAKIEYK